jgi:hypothetical protein
MTQQQVLEHEILAWTNAGQDGREDHPEEFKHVLSIADLRSREVLPPHKYKNIVKGAELASEQLWASERRVLSVS